MYYSLSSISAVSRCSIESMDTTPGRLVSDQGSTLSELVYHFSHPHIEQFCSDCHHNPHDTVRGMRVCEECTCGHTFVQGPSVQLARQLEKQSLTDAGLI